MKGREEQEKSTDVVASMWHVFSFHVNALLDLGSTLSFVTLLLASEFDLLHEILHQPFLVSTPIGDSVTAKRVC